MTKDLFSGHADIYAQFRPGYPDELIDHIISFVKERHRAWDCATGNGQAASMLAERFDHVDATDISASQLNNAIQKPNIHYQLSPAEVTPFPNDHFDLITVATAYHWINWDLFQKEAIRVGKQDAVVAVWTYYTVETGNSKLQQLYDHFYQVITKNYWQPERRFVDERYETIRFDFDPLPTKQFYSEMNWTKDQFCGYLESWSAVQEYKKIHGRSPLNLIINQLDEIWPDPAIELIRFPLALRMGRIKK